MAQNDSIRENMARSLRLLLKPLAKLLINQGISHKDFSEAAKEAFVEVAIREHNKNGKINRSRIAVVTGLTRKEVTAVIRRAMSEKAHTRTFSRPGRVLHGWHNDPHFLGPYGIPMDIPYDTDDGSPSFVELVRVYSGDQSPAQMLDELIRIEAVVSTADSLYRPIRREALAESLSPKMIERMGEVCFHMFNTMTANVQKKSMADGWFERVVVSSTPMTREEIAEFDAYLKERGQEMLVEIDNHLTTTVRKKPKDASDVFESGVAMVHYAHFRPEETESLRDLLVQYGIIDETSEAVARGGRQNLARSQEQR